MNRKPPNLYVREYRTRAATNESSTMSALRIGKACGYFIRKVYQTDPLGCPKCQGEMRIISFIDAPDVIKKILQHLGLWEESHAPPESERPIKELTIDPSYSQLI